MTKTNGVVINKETTISLAAVGVLLNLAVWLVRLHDKVDHLSAAVIEVKTVQEKVLRVNTRNDKRIFRLEDRAKLKPLPREQD